MAKSKAAAPRPPVHAVIYGPQGCGKSWLGASFGGGYLRGEVSRPTLVLLTDPRGKDAAYLGINGDGIGTNAYGLKQSEMYRTPGEFSVGKDSKGNDLVVPFVEVGTGSTLLTRIEYYHEEHLEFSDTVTGAGDLAVTGWTVLPKLRKRLNMLFRDEMDEWGTLVDDSQTTKELSIRNYHRYVQNNAARGEAQKKWWGAATDELEMVLAIRYANWRGNLLVVAHTDKDKIATEETEGGSTVVLRNGPALPGRLARDLPSYYPEVYHAFVERDADGGVTYLLQTRPSRFVAFSNFIKAPDPCENDYGALWVNWEGD